MKYQVGDLLLIKDCEYKPRPRLHPHPLLRLRLRPHLHVHLPLHVHLMNSFGIITEVVKHNDAWEGETTSDDNVYVWFSQVDAKEYNFCENGVTGEIVK